jgi:hypothetical protein
LWDDSFVARTFLLLKENCRIEYELRPCQVEMGGAENWLDKLIQSLLKTCEVGWNEKRKIGRNFGIELHG